MNLSPSAVPISTGELWIGRTLNWLVILFLLMDAGMKLVRTAPAVETTVQLGYPEGSVVVLGVVLLVCVILYAMPRTAVLGAILLTAYLGGAVATHVRVENPLLSHTLFPVYLGVILWAALYLTDRRLRALLPWR